jgi:NTE family protein
MNRDRLGLVLGSGGVLGYTWLVAALHTWADHTGVDPRESDVLIGTSAGSVVAAALAGGHHPDTLLRLLRGEPTADDPAVDWNHDRSAGGSLPPLPLLFGIGSPTLAGRVLRRPRRYPPMAAMAALLPRGRRPVDSLRAAVHDLTGGAGWPERPRTWIVTMDYDRGRRVVFGREGAPPATLPDAVAASCAIPGWYTPVQIAGRRYVDGGVCSTASADLLAGEGLDEVTVLAPLAGDRLDASWHPLVRAERWWRRRTTERLHREVARLRAAGTRVRVLSPDPTVLAEMGWNVMDPRRRRRVLDVALRSTASAWAGRPPEVAA